MTARARTIPLVLAIILVWCNRGLADAGLPQPGVTPRFRFENLADYPDYDFYLKYGHGSGNPYASQFVTKVNPATTVALEGNGSRVTPVVLLAVPHGRLTPEPAGASVATSWVAKSEDGVLQSDPMDWSNGSVALYRVKLDQDRLQVTASGSELLPLEWAAGNICITLPVGVALSLACILAGIWFVLRMRGRRAAVRRSL
jgi:hypothetical protein